MKAILALEDGTWFQGVSAGAPGETEGEVVFNTSMTGYQEVLTDPSYAGQIVTMTAPQIGNYGVAAGDAVACQPVAAHAEEVAAVEPHAAGVRLVHARQRVEERALAGAVGADDGEQLAAGDVEAHILERGDRAEPEREAADLKEAGRAQAVVAVGCLAERYGKDLAESLPEQVLERLFGVLLLGVAAQLAWRASRPRT